MDISIKVTVPKEILRMSIVQDSIAQVMTKKTAPEVKALFRKTVNGWQNKPSFRNKLTRRAGYMSETIWAEGSRTTIRGITVADQYQIVNYGSKKHTFGPRGQGYPLRFKHGSGYVRSTNPRILTSGPSSDGGHFVQTMSVNHPGFPAREFDKTIAKQYGPTFVKDIHDAISVAAAKSAAESNK